MLSEYPKIMHLPRDGNLLICYQPPFFPHALEWFLGTISQEEADMLVLSGVARYPRLSAKSKGEKNDTQE